jgi:hypothetical protein|uniref:Uncharacterized protein n=1 Tax=Populus trichocarpa TaxID=3694 RepID=U5GH89_POPTR
MKNFVDCLFDAIHKEDYPLDRVPKVTLIFLARGPLPMSPLLERFLKVSSIVIRPNLEVYSAQDLVTWDLVTWFAG